jgi:hypothetical protein
VSYSSWSPIQRRAATRVWGYKILPHGSKLEATDPAPRICAWGYKSQVQQLKEKLALDAEEAKEEIASLQKMINSLQHKETKERKIAWRWFFTVLGLYYYIRN